MAKSLRLTALLILLLSCFSLSARDIDLDALYLSESSQIYGRLISEKMDAYRRAGSRVIEKDVIFARWINGSEIIYIREFPSVNILYRYNRKSSRHSEIARVTGTIPLAEPGADGRYLYLKRLTIENGPVPGSYLLIININTGGIISRPTNYPFMDFSLSPGGLSFIYESRKGICEEFPESGIVRVLIPGQDYSQIRKARGNPTIAILSPNRQNSLLLNGSGGFYRSLLLSAEEKTPVNGISSAREAYWLNNDSIIYRSGTTGNYGITIQSVQENRKKQLISGSLNTNLCLSRIPGRAAFLYNQMIILYDSGNQMISKTGLEGEDVYFSHDGSHFLSLFHRTLFITHERNLQGKQARLLKTGESILSLYRQARGTGGIHCNEYSENYCRQKIDAYEKFLMMK